MIWRKLDCLNPNLQRVQFQHPPERRLKPAPPPAAGSTGACRNPPGRGTMPSEGIQGDELGAYVTLDTYGRDERGIAYGVRALWRHSARSSRRRNDLPGRTGEPSAGRRGTGDRMHMTGRYAKCKTPKRYWVSSATPRHRSLESHVHRKGAPSNSALDRPRRGQRFGRR